MVVNPNPKDIDGGGGPQSVVAQILTAGTTDSFRHRFGSAIHRNDKNFFLAMKTDHLSSVRTNLTKDPTTALMTRIQKQIVQLKCHHDCHRLRVDCFHRGSGTAGLIDPHSASTMSNPRNNLLGSLDKHLGQKSCLYQCDKGLTFLECAPGEKRKYRFIVEVEEESGEKTAHTVVSSSRFST